MESIVKFLDDSLLTRFVDYLEQIPYSTYSQGVVLDRADIDSFRYYHGNRYIVALQKGSKRGKGHDTEEKILGHLCIMIPASKYGYHQEHILEVHINVLPEFQSKGVGKALLAFFVKELKKWKHKNNITKIKTKMLGSNTPVIKLFEKFGFKIEAILQKEWKVLYEDHATGKPAYENAVYMSLMV